MKKLIVLSLCLMALLAGVETRAQQAAANATPPSAAPRSAAPQAAPKSAAAAYDTLARLKALPPAGQAQMVSDMLKAQLALDPAQYRQVSGIALQLAQQARPIIDSDDSRYSKLSQLRPLMQGAEQRLKSILHEDQYKKYLIFKQSIIDRVRAARS